jgi:hypothetical protein
MISASRTYRMLGNETLWGTAHRTHEVLAAAEIPHAIVGGVAVCLHGYRRNTVDVDLLIRPRDSEGVKSTLLDAGFKWHASRKEFTSPSGVAVQFVITGERSGPGSEVRFPDPDGDRVITIAEGLPVLSLARLIESKIACGEGNVRRTHKDFADVVELIAIRNLNQSFARHLHRSLRATFRELVRRARGEP